MEEDYMFSKVISLFLGGGPEDEAGAAGAGGAGGAKKPILTFPQIEEIKGIKEFTEQVQ
jgi:hypothetical protein